MMGTLPRFRDPWDSRERKNECGVFHLRKARVVSAPTTGKRFKCFVWPFLLCDCSQLAPHKTLHVLLKTPLNSLFNEVNPLRTAFKETE